MICYAVINTNGLVGVILPDMKDLPFYEVVMVF